jgi:hypothetical protein
VIYPNATYVNFEIFMPRRVCTDGHQFPIDEQPSFMGTGAANGSIATARFDLSK